MAECTHDCSTCGLDCASRSAGAPKKEKTHEGTHVKKVIGIVSGKGGVGKSLVTSMMAVTAKRRGHSVAVMDADITGPSIGRVFGVKQQAMATKQGGIIPVMSKTGIELMSTNFLLPEETDPVVWRGSIISGAVKQFWTDVMWGDVDYMFIDMPPGTGDVPLTVFQSLPVDGIIIVASPQELVSMIVEKAVKMANMMKIPVIGLVENMSYVECPDCGKKIYLFGESKVGETAEKYNLPVLAEMPIRPEIAKLCDDGDIESFDGDYMSKAMDIIEKSL